MIDILDVQGCLLINTHCFLVWYIYLRCSLGSTNLGIFILGNYGRVIPNNSFIHVSYHLSQRKIVDQIQGKFQIWEESKQRSLYLEQPRAVVEEKGQLYQQKKSINEWNGIDSNERKLPNTRVFSLLPRMPFGIRYFPKCPWSTIERQRRGWSWPNMIAQVAHYNFWRGGCQEHLGNLWKLRDIFGNKEKLGGIWAILPFQ